MTPTQKQPAPRIRLAWFYWLGAGLLVVSILGASKGLSPGETSTSSTSSTRSDLPVAGFGHVDVDGGIANMYPAIPGAVVEVLAHDGDQVDKDMPLFRVDDEIAQNDLKRAQKAVNDAELVLAGAKNIVKQHQEKMNGQRAAVKVAQSKVKVAEAQLAEAKRLLKAEQIGKEKADQAEEAVNGYKAAVEGEEAKERAYAAEDPTVAVRQAENNLEEKNLLVKKAKYGLDKCTVRAPAKGQVLRMLVAVGDMLGPNPRQPAVQFAADGPRIIRAEIDQEFADGVHVGQEFKVEDDVPRGVFWTGRVKRVSNWYTHRRSIMLEPGQFNDLRTLEVIIVLDDQSADLKIGQKVLVTQK